MRAILADHDDFKNEKCQIDTFLSNSGHTCFHPEVLLRVGESIVPEQAIHEGILRLHHQLTSTEHSSGAGERHEGEHCKLCASMPELLCLPIRRDLESDVNWRILQIS